MYNETNVTEQIKNLLHLGYDIEMATQTEIEKAFKLNANGKKLVNYCQAKKYFVIRGFMLDYIFGQYDTIEEFINKAYSTVIRWKHHSTTNVTDDMVNKVLNLGK